MRTFTIDFQVFQVVMGKTEFYDFIKNNLEENPDRLRFAYHNKKFDFNLDLAITQIECRKKYKQKFHEILKNPHFLFPDNLSAEQASHQSIARYHSLFSQGEKKILDLTAGLGMDVIYMSSHGGDTTAIELNSDKAEILKQNCENLGLGNIKVIKGDAIDFLKKTPNHYDLIFVDPSRRDSLNKRVFILSDCSPDIVANQELLFEHSSRILIKASPLLDITQTLKDLLHVKTIRAIGVKGECKELLVELDTSFQNEKNDTAMEAINLDLDGNVVSSFKTVLKKGNEGVKYAANDEIKEGGFLLEPSAMLMKLSAWSDICNRYEALKLSPSSHLFISNHLPEGFQGRVSKIIKIIKKTDRKILKGLPATIVSKNYPISSDELRKKLQLKEGDKNFIYASRIGNIPILILSEPVSH